MAAIGEQDITAWLIDWDRALKTRANYHGLMYAIFNYAVEQGFLTNNPCARTAPKRRRVKQSQAELRFLSEDEFAAVVAKAGSYPYSAADLIRVTAGTDLRFGEVTALWVSDIDLRKRTIRVNKAWKRVGENGETEIPSWLKKQIRDKHTMREHYLSNPKTPKSRRTVSISSRMASILENLIEGKAANNFVFVSPTGRPVHNSDFYTRVWRPLMDELIEDGIAAFRFHDLRHTHVSWLIAGGAPLPHIQARLGHESITTTIDTYGHLLPAGDELISDIVDAVMNGRADPAAPPSVARWRRRRGSLSSSRDVTLVHIAQPESLPQYRSPEASQACDRGPSQSRACRGSGREWNDARLAWCRNGLLASGDELVEVLDAEPYVLADSTTTDALLAYRVSHPTSRDVEVGGRLIDGQQVRSRGRTGLGCRLRCLGSLQQRSSRARQPGVLWEPAELRRTWRGSRLPRTSWSWRSGLART